MTRADIVGEAARRLGDQSAEFLADVDAAFDFVLGDLHQHEVIGDLVKLSTAAVLVADQRDYSTRTITGLATPHYPDDILDIKIWAFAAQQPRRAETNREFEDLRIADGEDARGRPRLWRFWPNVKTLQFHPPAGAEEAGETLEVTYIAPPPTLASLDEIEDLRQQDLETIVFGLKWRMAEFKEEFLEERALNLQAYIAGRDKMWARRWNNRVGQVAPTEI